mgnify:FL=1
MSRLQTRGTPEPRINLKQIERTLAQGAATNTTLRSDVNNLVQRMQQLEFELDTDRR